MTKMKRKGLLICALAMGAATIAGAAFGQGANQGLNIAIATGGTGGGYYPLGGGMANGVAKKLPGGAAAPRGAGRPGGHPKIIGSPQRAGARAVVAAVPAAPKG